MSSGFDPTIGALNTVMNLRMMQQNVTVSNIANADTPGYKAKAVEFEGALRDALEGIEEGGEAGYRKATAAVDPEIYDDPTAEAGLDGNTVNRANEMAKLAENQALFDAATEALKRKLGMLKYAISEGGGNR